LENYCGKRLDARPLSARVSELLGKEFKRLLRSAEKLRRRNYKILHESLDDHEFTKFHSSLK